MTCPDCEALRARVLEEAAKVAGDYLRLVFDQPTMAREVELAVQGNKEAVALLRTRRRALTPKDGGK